jgi:hypothetical protein
MAHDIIIELWHDGGHWSLKKVVIRIGIRANKILNEGRAAAWNDVSECGTGFSLRIDG